MGWGTTTALVIGGLLVVVFGIVPLIVMAGQAWHHARRWELVDTVHGEVFDVVSRHMFRWTAEWKRRHYTRWLRRRPGFALLVRRREAEAFRTWPPPHDHVNPFSQVTHGDKE